MIRILVCPFGGVNLLLSLIEKLRRRLPGKYDVTYVSYTEYGRQIYRRLDARHVHVPPGEADAFFPKETLNEVIAFTRKLARINLGDPLEAPLARAANHYGAALDNLFAADAYDYVVEFNGRMNLFITVLDVVADRRDTRKLVFEQGLFRPDYITVDGRGVNYRNSIDSLEALLSPDPFPCQKTELYRDLLSLLPMDPNEITDFKRQVPKLRLAMAYARMRFQPRDRIYLRDAEGRDLLEAGMLRKRRPAPPTHILDDVLARAPFRHVILCPFQVETDTQVLLHSPMVRNMRDYMDIITDALQQYNAGRTDRACALFKIHPMHDLHVHLDRDDIFIINESTVAEILKRRCDLVITINSTAGIEAIEAGLPVITLGEAFFNMPGVISAHCTDPGQLAELIRRALHETTTDPDLQTRFLDALRNKYQVRLH